MSDHDDHDVRGKGSVGHWSLVVGQFAASVALIFSTRWPGLHGPALLLLVFGIGILLWAVLYMGLGQLSVMPEPARAGRLIRNGPYRWVRHPMYTGLLMATAGCLLSFPLWWRWFLWCGLCWILDRKARIEERYLRQRFPEYEQYAANVRRFIPYIY